MEMPAWSAWPVLVVAVWLAHWGADRLAAPLEKLRRRWGFSAPAGAALVAIATASPEISTNAASAMRGVSDIGLGNLLGANIVSVPVIVAVAYLATRQDYAHVRAGRHHLLPLARETNAVQTTPYVVIVALVGLLTLPAPWRGLQPIDGWIMLIVYIAYMVHALLRHRRAGSDVSWLPSEFMLGVIGVSALSIGAYLTVRATESIVVQLHISELLGGVFITAPMSVLPEAFATWSLARSNQVTSATTTVIADNIATMTLAFLPLALVTTAINDMRLYSINFTAVSVLAVAYWLFVHFRRDRRGFEFWEVVGLIGLYLIYLAVMVFGVLNT